MIRLSLVTASFNRDVNKQILFFTRFNKWWIKIWYKDETKYFKSYKQRSLWYNYIDINVIHNFAFYYLEYIVRYTIKTNFMMVLKTNSFITIYNLLLKRQLKTSNMSIHSQSVSTSVT